MSARMVLQLGCRLRVEGDARHRVEAGCARGLTPPCDCGPCLEPG